MKVIQHMHTDLAQGAPPLSSHGRSLPVLPAGGKQHYLQGESSIICRGKAALPADKNSFTHRNKQDHLREKVWYGRLEGILSLIGSISCGLVTNVEGK